MISVAVMACREREAQVNDLLSRLDRPANVAWDTQRDRWETGKRAWQARDRRMSHHLVLQDDVLPAPDLIAGLERAVEHVPDNPICLYTSGRAKGKNSQAGQSRARQAAQTGSSWFTAPGPWWGPGILLPARHIEPMIEWVERHAAHRPNYDWRIAEYFAAQGTECYYTAPSLVEHRDEPSIVRAERPDQGRGRTAFNFTGVSALDIDWSRKPVSGLSVAVMAHPERTRFVRELISRLDRAPEVVWDRRGDIWDTGRRSLLAFDPSASHHLVIQDDAIPCRDLVAGLERAVLRAGPRPVGAYMNLVRPKQTPDKALIRARYARAEQTGATWLSMQGPLWGVAAAIPTVHIPEMVEWCDGLQTDSYDARLTAFYAHRKIDCWYTLPSLVEHRSPTGNPSLVGGSTKDRRAARFIGAETSALGIEWGVAPGNRDVTFTHRRSGRRSSVEVGSPAYGRMTRYSDWEEVAA